MSNIAELEKALASKEKELSLLEQRLPRFIGLNDQLIWDIYNVQDDIISLKRQISLCIPASQARIARTAYPDDLSEENRKYISGSQSPRPTIRRLISNL